MWLRRHERTARCDGLVRRDSVLISDACRRGTHTRGQTTFLQGRGAVSCSVANYRWPTGVPRINVHRVGRVTRSEPTNASSIATKRDSRNPPPSNRSEPRRSARIRRARSTHASGVASSGVTQWETPVPRGQAFVTARRAAAPASAHAPRRLDARLPAARARATAPPPVAP